MKPQPRINLLTQPFWDGANEEKLFVQQCEQTDCKKHIFYPRASCPFCYSPQLRWVEANGEGFIISNTTIHRPHHEGFVEECPYVFAAIQLAEGPCIYGKVIDAPIDTSLVNKPVSVKFEFHSSKQKIPVFVLLTK